MIVYKDLISGDEMMSDSYPQRPVVDEEGEEIPGMFEVDSRNVLVGGEEIDIGNSGPAEGEAEEAAPEGEMENNIIAAFHYTELEMRKSDLKAYLQDYMRSLRQTMKANGVEQPKIKEFMANAGVIAKYLLANFSNLQTYMSESCNPDAGLAFATYKEGNSTPTFMYISHGLEQVKF